MPNHSLGALALALFAAAVVPSDAFCQEAEVAPAQTYSCVTDNIDWVLPADFDKALARSKSEQRLLLIKGVSFGIDAAGAGCATKGKW